MPTSRPTSRIALRGGAIVLLGVGLLTLIGRLPVEFMITAWIAWFVLGVVLLHDWWTWLFGPVFFYDLIRTSRKARNTLFRCLYGFGLLIVLYFVYDSWFGQYLTNLDDLFAPAALPRDAVPRFAEHFFTAFMVVQVLTVALLTPAYVAGAITEERERGTLEFICTTDLTPREVVLGKFLSRLANMSLLVLAGLPVLSLTVFLGGVDPVRVVIGFVMTFMLMISLAGLAMLISVNSRRTLNAVIGTYAMIAMFTFCCPFLAPLLCLNPLLSVGSGDALIPYMLGFGIFTISQLVVGIVCLVLAVDGLTWQPTPVGQGVLTRQLPAMPARVVVSEPEKPPPPPPLLERPADFRWPRPPVDDRALLWKELHAEPLLGLAEFGPLVTVLSLMLLAILAMILLVAGLAFTEARQYQPDLGGYLNTFLRPMTAFIGTCFCFGVGIIASGAVSREIERRTLDGLLTLPVTSDEILFAKLLGAGYALRGVAWNLAAIWLLGLLTGGFHIVGLVLLILATVIHSAFFATLGLWLSTICRGTTRALLLTVLLSLVLLIVPWLTEGQFDRLFTAAGLEPGTIRFVNLVQGYLTPTVAQYRLGFALSDSTAWPRVPAILVGLLIYCLIGGGLWVATRRRLTDNQIGGVS